MNLLSLVGQWQNNSWIESLYVFEWCDYSWMFCHKCDIADLIFATSQKLRNYPANAWLGQPVTDLIHSLAKEVVPGCWGSMGSCPWRLWETFQVNLNHKKNWGLWPWNDGLSPPKGKSNIWLGEPCKKMHGCENLNNMRTGFGANYLDWFIPAPKSTHPIHLTQPNSPNSTNPTHPAKFIKLNSSNQTCQNSPRPGVGKNNFPRVHPLRIFLGGIWSG